MAPVLEGGMGSQPHPYLRLDHVDPPGAEGLHAIVNIHDTLTLGHVQHYVQNDVAACSSCACTVVQRREHPHMSEHKMGQRKGPEAFGQVHPRLKPGIQRRKQKEGTVTL